VPSVIGAILLLAGAATATFPEPGFRFRKGAVPGVEGIPVELRIEGPPERGDLFVEDGTPFPRWKWIGGAVSERGRVTLRAPSRSRALLLLRGAGAREYALEGSFVWPETPCSRPVRALPRRTLRGSGAIGGKSELRLVGTGAGQDPLCETDGASAWQCVGVPAEFTGRIVACDDGRAVAAAEVRPDLPDETVLRRLVFALLLRIDAVEEGEGPFLPSTRVVRPVTAEGLVLAPDRGWGTSNLGEGLVWIEGGMDPAGRTAEVRAPGFATRRIELSGLPPACAEPIAVTLERASPLEGRVLDRSGNPVAGAIVLVRPDDSSRQRILAETRTDEEGVFEFRDLESRRYRVRACDGAFGCGERSASPGEPVRIALDGGGAFVGRVLSSSGVPEPGATVRIVPTLESWAGASDRIRRLPLETVTDSDGRFRISAPDTGDFLLEARSGASGVARLPVRRSSYAPALTDLGDLRLPEPVEFFVDVVGCGSGALSFSGPLGGETSLPTLVRVALQPAGATTVRLPEGGAWTVWATCGGRNETVEPAVLPDVAALAGVEIRFERAGRLSERSGSP
jgi:hypothetical protein